MRRRQFAALGAGGATTLAWSRRSPAQQSAKLPRIGWLWNGRSAGNPQEVSGFREGLKEFGYVDGQNVLVDYRFSEGQPARIPPLAAELMRLRPDVLVAFGTAVVGTIKGTTGDLPVVSLSGNPVGASFIASLAHPGGHITGVSMMQGQEGLTGKRIELLPEMAAQFLQRRLPVVSELRLLVETGGLLSYGPSIFDASRRLVYFVDRILKGTKPADLPVEQASKIELLVNLKTARLLNIALPQILLAGADEVLE